MLMFGTIKQLGSLAVLFSVIQLVQNCLIHVQHLSWTVIFRRFAVEHSQLCIRK